MKAGHGGKKLSRHSRFVVITKEMRIYLTP